MQTWSSCKIPCQEHSKESLYVVLPTALKSNLWRKTSQRISLSIYILPFVWYEALISYVESPKNPDTHHPLKQHLLRPKFNKFRRFLRNGPLHSGQSCHDFNGDVAWRCQRRTTIGYNALHWDTWSNVLGRMTATLDKLCEWRTWLNICLFGGWRVLRLLLPHDQPSETLGRLAREFATTYSDIDRRGGAAFFWFSHKEIGVFRTSLPANML